MTIRSWELPPLLLLVQETTVLSMVLLFFLVELGQFFVLFCTGVIELCRRLGHEAFGEEDDEVQYDALCFNSENSDFLLIKHKVRNVRYMIKF